MNRKIDFIYIDSGGGHRAAATALAEVIRQQRRPWELRPLNIQDLLDSIDFIRKSTGIQFQELYNIMLRRNWTLGAAHLIPVMHMLIRLLHNREVRLLEQHWKRGRPDMVVSLIPHYNRALKQALERIWPGTPLVTILTDIADYPPHFWIERQDQYVICGSKRAADQALALGLPEDRLRQVSGMILNPKFYAPLNLDRGAERIKLGLRPNLPTGLVLFGGQGSMDMVKIARALNNSSLDMQLILLCGRHEMAERQLRSLPGRMPAFVGTFTTEIPYYMALSDFFVGKAGPGSVSEALAMRLPVIVERNAWTLPQERYNADWIQERQLGIVVSNFSRIAEAVRELLEPEAYGRYRNNAAGIRNRAVFEIPELLDRILLESSKRNTWEDLSSAPPKHDAFELFHPSVTFPPTDCNVPRRKLGI
jgi:UDP-N-acetylglucosamine:LPS N-acetylglucosamine transferase